MGFPSGTLVRNLPANAGDTGDVGSIPGLGRSPAVGNGNPLQNSWLENSTDRGGWRAIVNAVAKRCDCMCVCVHAHVHMHTHARARTHTHTHTLDIMG